MGFGLLKPFQPPDNSGQAVPGCTFQHLLPLLQYSNPYWVFMQNKKELRRSSTIVAMIRDSRRKQPRSGWTILSKLVGLMIPNLSSPLLALQNTNLSPPVFCPAFIGIIFSNRHRGTITFKNQALGINTIFNQIVINRFCPPGG